MVNSNLQHFQQVARDVVCASGALLLTDSVPTFVPETLAEIAERLPQMMLNSTHDQRLGRRYIQLLQNNVFIEDDQGLHINPELMRISTPFTIDKKDISLLAVWNGGIVEKDHKTILQWIDQHRRASLKELEISSGSPELK